MRNIITTKNCYEACCKRAAPVPNQGQRYCHIARREQSKISFVDALKRIVQLAMIPLRKAHKLSEKVITAMFDVIMGQAVAYFGLFDGKKPQLVGVLR